MSWGAVQTEMLHESLGDFRYVGGTCYHLLFVLERKKKGVFVRLFANTQKIQMLKVNDIHRSSLSWRTGAEQMGPLLVGSRDTRTEGRAFAAKTGRPEFFWVIPSAWRAQGLPREECPAWERAAHLACGDQGGHVHL